MVVGIGDGVSKYGVLKQSNFNVTSSLHVPLLHIILPEETKKTSKGQLRRRY